MPYCGRSILLRLDAELVAETLCLIEMEYFKSVGWPELLAYAKASASDSPGSSQNLQAIVTRFNQVCRWLSDEIQLSPGTAEQAELISALIRIAFVPFAASTLPPCLCIFRSAWHTPTTTRSCRSS